MHPGEQHIRGEMMTAIFDHFNDLAITVDGVPYVVDIYGGVLSGPTITVTHPNGAVVAQYRIKMSAERISPPKSGSPKAAAVPEPELCDICKVSPMATHDADRGYCVGCKRGPLPPAAPTWHEGAWEDIRQGDTVLAPDGNPWDVTEYRLHRDGSPRVTISNGIETHTFNPEPNVMVKYFLRSEGV